MRTVLSFGLNQSQYVEGPIGGPVDTAERPPFYHHTHELFSAMSPTIIPLAPRQRIVSMILRNEAFEGAADVMVSSLDDLGATLVSELIRSGRSAIVPLPVNVASLELEAIVRESSLLTLIIF